ncbi:MAG TPA: LPS assembly lipoprotein LptE [Rhodocyclaceae bacterium]|nr:LPS assembly lipoprotein LptE [Rhodocyclaceae bacterium]
MSANLARRGLLAGLGTLLVATLAGGCGFRMRGPRPLAFKTLYVGLDANSELGSALRRRVLTSGTTVVVDDPATADARLEVLQNSRDREILTLSSAGTVREYLLTLTIRFRLVARSGEELLAPVTLSVRRDYNFADAQIIAKEREEALLFRDMENDLLQQVMDRLATVAP